MTLAEVSDRLKAPASRWVLYPVLLVSLVAAFSAGRFSAPERVEERVEYRTELRTVTVQAKARERVVYREKVTTPDGTVTEKTSLRDVSKVDTTTKAAASTTAVQERKTELRADWRVGAQIGASMQKPALVITGPLVLGVTVERRVVGGLSAGLWANTVGAGGAIISVEF
jgi:hypothetical protein